MLIAPTFRGRAIMAEYLDAEDGDNSGCAGPLSGTTGADTYVRR